CQQHSSYPFTF
nr:immunoglobulin light chain junction region [Macaca mulatta]MOW08633.1 immunoglobulin light chain junction region [Macaca mulatta]MOW09193.1 immunoglobulin light chain junction region [Macaca mulatta]MOW09500.1 immunoglobulin light chain junction region [Macaca mulatta]MOW09709.1 immunoglobulin light chain junction region [Macaca mulatta]